MQFFSPGLHLDPLLPLAVSRDPKLLPTPSAGTARGLLFCWEGSCAISEVTGRQPACAPTLIKVNLEDNPVFTRRPAGCSLIIVGGKLLDELVVAAFGEPGFSRFLREIDDPGVCPCGAFDNGLENAIAALADELAQRQPAYRVRARAMLSEILLLTYRSSLARPVLANGDGLRLGAVLDHIEFHYADELRLEELAALMGTSPSYFSRLFRSEVGMPLFEYINRTRIRKACLMLRRPDIPVTRIAFDVGYNSVSFFNRYFRRIMNVTPREYRRFLSG